MNEYSCECQPGYSGKNCQKNIDECAASPCHYRGICLDEINDYECVCQTGFEGKNCSSMIDHCVKNPCQNGGDCKALLDDYKCKCADHISSGFFLHEINRESVIINRKSCNQPREKIVINPESKISIFEDSNVKSNY